MFVAALGAELVLFLVFLQQPAPMPDPAMPPVADPSDGTFRMQVVMTITMILGFLYNAWMQRAKVNEDRRKDELRIKEETMKRQWDLEDRQHAREEAERKLERVHAQIIEAKEVAAVTAQKVDDRATHLEQKLEANTAISVQAFDRANDFNTKLGAVLQKFEANDASIELRQTSLRAVPTEGKTDAGPPETASPD